MVEQNDPENGTVLASEDLKRLRIVELEVALAESSARVNDLKWELSAYERAAQKCNDREMVDLAKKRRADVLEGIESKYEMGLNLSSE
jgi:hypothetical protein